MVDTSILDPRQVEHSFSKREETIATVSCLQLWAECCESVHRERSFRIITPLSYKRSPVDLYLVPGARDTRHGLLRYSTLAKHLSDIRTTISPRWRLNPIIILDVTLQ
jgi:hypothetical protein